MDEAGVLRKPDVFVNANNRWCSWRQVGTHIHTHVQIDIHINTRVKFRHIHSHISMNKFICSILTLVLSSTDFSLSPFRPLSLSLHSHTHARTHTHTHTHTLTHTHAFTYHITRYW